MLALLRRFLLIPFAFVIVVTTVIVIDSAITTALNASFEGSGHVVVVFAAEGTTGNSVVHGCKNSPLFTIIVISTTPGSFTLATCAAQHCLQAFPTMPWSPRRGCYMRQPRACCIHVAEALP